MRKFIDKIRNKIESIENIYWKRFVQGTVYTFVGMMLLGILIMFILFEFPSFSFAFEYIRGSIATGIILGSVTTLVEKLTEY